MAWSIVLPAYYNYIVRSQMSEALAAVPVYYDVDQTDRGSDAPANLVVIQKASDVCIIAVVNASVWGGAVGTTGQFALNGKKHADDATMNWECVRGATLATAVPDKYLPANGRDDHMYASREGMPEVQ